MADADFWRHKALSEMSLEEWELLCDGCAICCVLKLEEEDSGALDVTNVACHLLDLDTCRCTDYPHRMTRVPDCIELTAGNAGKLEWLPSTCAYRLVDRGEELPSWHPLVSGEATSVHRAGASLMGQAVSENDVAEEDLDDYIIARLVRD